MKTRTLQTLWWDWLGTSERLLRSLGEQTIALTIRDAARVDRLQPELDQLLNRMREIDEKATAASVKLAESLGTEPKLRSLLAALSPAEAETLKTIATRVEIVSQNIDSQLSKNRALIENELNFVSGSLALIAKVATTQDGSFQTRKVETVLLDQVA